MAEFLKDSQVLSAVEQLIDQADEFLWLISPYIKLHDKIKDRLKLKKSNPNLHIIIIFGKNEEDTSKSLCKEDLDFFKDFPNITIGYEKRLHAKFYASEDSSIITSMNLHEFSHNNNIEAGIKFKSNKWISQLTGKSPDIDALEHFKNIIDNSNTVFDKEPIGKGGLFGFGALYSHSEIKTDESETFFKKKEAFVGKKYFQRKILSHSQSTMQGFCIRTGKPIPFNVQRPMCLEAWKEWNKTKNVNSPEKFCHYSGEPSNGETSYNKPIMRKNWNKTKG